MLATRFARCLAGLVLAASASSVYAATASTKDSDARVALAQLVAPQVAKATDLGAVDGAQTLPSMKLHFAMTPAKQAALQQLLANQQNPASSQYHRWLTPEQFRTSFGVEPEQERSVLSWLAAQGFIVNEVSRGGLFVRFSGTVAQATQAFGASVHHVRVNGEVHTANVGTLSVPAGFATVITSVVGMDDIRPRSHGTVRDVNPLYTTSGGTHYLAPGDFDKTYNVSSLPSGTNGAGVTIAIAGQSDINLSDIAAFQAAAGLAAKTPSVSTYGADPGSASAADLDEAEMDVEWAGAIAPGSTILYVNSTDAVAGSLTEAIDYDVAPIIESSYGSCEANLGTTALADFELLFEQASSEGITIVAASGDSGATDCDANVGSAVNGLAVDFPASSPYVTGVGGTEFNEGTGTYWSSSNSGTLTASATGHIPEIVWNDDNTVGLSATGGGASAYFAKPSWQTGTPTDAARDVPDVSLAASINHDGYLICVGSTNCTSGFSNASGGFVVSGGTSAAAAAFAGMLALVEQKVDVRLGNANQVIYALGNSSFDADVFYDITSGTNASACTTGTLNCYSGGTIGYVATAGYDRATGWGSVNAYNLVNDWSSVTPLAAMAGEYPSVTTVAGNLASAIVGTPITFTITVASDTALATATPTGMAQMTVDGTAVGSAVTLSSGTATYSLDTTGLSVGTHTVQATYEGDATYEGSRAAFVITVTAASGADFALTPATANVTVKSDTIATPVVFTVSSLGGFTGSVKLTASLVSPLAALSSFSVNPVVVTSSATSATTQFVLLAYTNSSKVEAPHGLPMRQREGVGVVLALLVMCVMPRRRKFAWLAVVLLGVGVMGMSGCARSTTPTTTSTQTTTGTPAGTYSVIIQATATINGAVTEHTATVTYVVQ